MGKFIFASNKQPGGKALSADVPIEVAVGDLQTMNAAGLMDRLEPGWVFSWEPTDKKEKGDKIIIGSHQTLEQRQAMLEIMLALAYPCRATGYNEWVFYNLADVERDEFGFITNATIKRVSTA